MEDLQKNSQLESLYYKYIGGNASEDDLKIIRKLCEASTEWKRRFLDAETVIKQTDDYLLMKNIDTESAFVLFNDRIKQYRKSHNWIYYWQKLAAILLVPLLIASGWLFFKKANVHELPKQQAIVYNVINTTSGLRSHFILPDGTKVWLNGDTQLRYPLSFSNSERRIYLSGEAYFEVAKDKTKPFVVDVGKLTVEALGTTFNCMAYPDDQTIETALVEGKVRVTRLDEKEKREYILKPGQLISYKPKDKKFYLEEGNLDKYVAWREGKFVFRNDPLEEICQKLGRWFHADIIIKDESIKNYAFTGTFQKESLIEILSLISLTSPIDFKTSKRKMDENDQYETLKIEIMKK